MHHCKECGEKGNFGIEESAVQIVGKYASNGRDAVNIIQLAGGVALTEGRSTITTQDVEWVVQNGNYTPRPDKKVWDAPRVGCVNGLAVYGPNMGAVMEIEATAVPAAKGKGEVIVTGIIDEEEMNSESKKVRRKSTAKGSVDNVMTILRNCFNINTRNYDIHINFPGGTPVDGPSAGIAILTAVYSAITGLPVDNKLAMTGELSIQGYVKPVGEVPAKVNAAIHAGASRVIIPSENWQDNIKNEKIEVIPVKRVEEVIELAVREIWDNSTKIGISKDSALLSASSAPDNAEKLIKKALH